MLLLVGLGNPGARYAGNRHNIGFMAVQEIARRHGIARKGDRFLGVIPEGLGVIVKGNIDGTPVRLLLPGTYMNDAGHAVMEAMRAFKLALGDITVFHDEIELHPAYVRVKIGGGNAGHNGLRSISGAIGNNYRRVCIGVGRPPVGETVDHYVLRNFEVTEHSWIVALLTKIADNAGLLVHGEDELFENKIHRDMSEAGFSHMLSYSSSRPKRTKSRREPPADR
jgi:PTH1 family peptidyl-tRNA hydrolase